MDDVIEGAAGLADRVLGDVGTAEGGCGRTLAQQGQLALLG